MAQYFKIISEVITPKDGEPVVNIQLTKEASDWLCKAMSMLVQRTSDNNGDRENLDEYQQLQQEVIRAWEIFRP